MNQEDVPVTILLPKALHAVFCRALAQATEEQLQAPGHTRTVRVKMAHVLRTALQIGAPYVLEELRAQSREAVQADEPPVAEDEISPLSA
jgi:hypothetical protein